MFVHLRDHIRGSIKVAFDIFQGSQQGLYLLISFSLKEYQCDYTKELSTGDLATYHSGHAVHHICIINHSGKQVVKTLSFSEI